MNSKKIAHESPISIFDDIQKVTDLDYGLVHLFDENKAYRQKFFEAREKNREIILDTSVFELGTHYDIERYKFWIQQLQPTWYIVPDVLEDCFKTVHNAINWKVKNKDLPGKTIGVVQGKNYCELKNCYQMLDKVVNVDMIAISFDYSYYQKSFPHTNKYVSWMLGRVKLLGDLLKEDVINKNKRHHLLGISLAREGYYYKDYDWIYSVDSSNPVVAAINNIRYITNMGLYSKEKQKLFTLIDYPKEKINQEILNHNIKEFRKYWS